MPESKKERLSFFICNNNFSKNDGIGTVRIEVLLLGEPMMTLELPRLLIYCKVRFTESVPDEKSISPQINPKSSYIRKFVKKQSKIYKLVLIKYHFILLIIYKITSSIVGFPFLAGI